MVGIAELTRFCDETGSVAGGDVRAQLEAWGIQHDEFFEFVTVWANTNAIRFECEPYALVVAMFAGFELGYRSALEIAPSGPTLDDFNIDEMRS